MDRNASHPAVAPIYFPQELSRVESLERDLEHFFGSEWRKRVIVPAATQRYGQRLRQVSTAFWRDSWFITQSAQEPAQHFPLLTFSDRQREPRASSGPRLHSLPRWSLRGTSAGKDYPEISRSEQQRGAFLLPLPRCEQPQPFQAAVQEPDEQHRADGEGEGRGAGGGRAGLWAEHTGERPQDEFFCASPDQKWHQELLHSSQWTQLKEELKLMHVEPKCCQHANPFF